MEGGRGERERERERERDTGRERERERDACLQPEAYEPFSNAIQNDFHI